MKSRRFLNDVRGAAAIEFGITAPVFIFLVIATIESGLMLWTQLGLQQGVEMGARCAGIESTVCSSTSATQNYASQQTYGVSPPASIFTVTDSSCGKQVSANYDFPILWASFGTITLKAQACFPH